MSVTTCPDRDTLFGYVVGTIPEDAAERVAAHLASCSDCEKTVQALEGLSDTLISALRNPERQDAHSSEPECRSALENLHQLRGPESQGDRAGEAETQEPARVTKLGDYELVQKLGQGGMGTVYKARHAKLKRVVALKMLPQDRLKDSEAVARFEREMEAVGRLDHPNIARATDAREVQGVRFLVMEYVDGLDLSKVVKWCGPPSIADACEVIRQAACGLACSHENGLVHRDVKPSNLMLSAGGQVKMLDLGLAHFHEAESLGGQITGIGQVMGTPDYLSPEQAVESHTVDIRSDIYSLGCTLYHLLAGHAPFSGPDYDSPMKKVTGHMRDPVQPIGLVRPEVPEGIRTLLERMLAKDPEQRFASPSQVANALAPYCKGSKLIGLLRDAQRQKPAEPKRQNSCIETEELRGSALVDTSRTETPAAESEKPSNKASFDPYHRWLGIRPEEQPANHYRLLGLSLFEDDPEVIRDAAARQMAHVRTYHLGQHAELSQKVLNELAAAKACLRSDQKKAAYDDRLREQLRSRVADVEGPEREQPPADDVIALPRIKLDSKSPAKSWQFPRLSRPALWPTAIGLVGFLFLLSMGIVLTIHTGKGSVKITLSDPAADVQVKVDGDVIEIAGLGEPIQFRAGKHELIVTGPNYETVSRSFTAQRGGKSVLTVQLVLQSEASASQLRTAMTPEALHLAPKEKNPGYTGTDNRTSEEVHAALLVKNPDYRGQGKFTVENGQIVKCNLQGCGIQDLAPLQGLALRDLNIMDNRVNDLSPLEGMRIGHLLFGGNKIADVSPLRGMPLRMLEISGNRVQDLSPLHGMVLTELVCDTNNISDLSPLRGMRLKRFRCIGNPLRDLSPLRGMPLQLLDCSGTKVTDLTPLEGMPLVALGITGLDVENLSPLRGMPLRRLAFSPQRCGDFGFLRAKQTLTSITIGSSLHALNDAIPASDFWGERGSTVPGQPPKGPVLWYSFDQPNQIGLVVDESGMGNDGAVRGAKWTPDGNRGGAYQFSFKQANDCIIVPDSDSLDVEHITITAWIKTQDQDEFWNRIADKDYRYGYNLCMGGDLKGRSFRGKVVFELNMHWVVSDAVVGDGRWHHVAATYDGSVQRLFVDGVQQRQVSKWEGTIGKNSSDLEIGNSQKKYGQAESLAFDGAIDELRIYDYALGPDEIRQLHAEGVTADSRQHVRQGTEDRGSSSGLNRKAAERVIPITRKELHRALKKNPNYRGQGKFTEENGKIVRGNLRACGIRDLAPLKGLALRDLNIMGNRVNDLSPLRGMPLKTLRLSFNPIADLSPLSDMPLRILGLGNTKVVDLSPLQGLRLREFSCWSNNVSDLSPLRGMPLRVLKFTGNNISDLSPLRGMPLTQLICANNQVRDLSPLRGMPLRKLDIGGMAIVDLTPLDTLPLTELAFSPDQVQADFDFLRDKATLERIATNPNRPLRYDQWMSASKFWKQWDATHPRSAPSGGH